MTAEALNVWSVTVIDRACNEIGTVSISLMEDWLFTQKRLYDLINVMDDVAEQALDEYTRLELTDKREKRLSGYDQTIVQGFRSAFPADDVNRLFEQHRPTETVDGRAYCLVLLEAVMRGFRQAMDGHKDHTWIQIDV